jgi:hypothetical protein
MISRSTSTMREMEILDCINSDTLSICACVGRRTRTQLPLASPALAPCRPRARSLPRALGLPLARPFVAPLVDTSRARDDTTRLHLRRDAHMADQHNMQAAATAATMAAPPQYDHRHMLNVAGIAACKELAPLMDACIQQTRAYNAALRAKLDLLVGRALPMSEAELAQFDVEHADLAVGDAQTLLRREVLEHRIERIQAYLRLKDTQVVGRKQEIEAFLQVSSG